MEEAQLDDAALALVQRLETGLDHRTLLDALVPALFLADQLGQGLPVLVEGSREAANRVCVRGLEGFDHLILVGVGGLGQLFDGRRVPELGAQAVEETGQADVELLDAPRNVDRPGLVAEVALDLTEDRRHRVRGQLDAAVRVEAVDRVDEADRADLDEVVEHLAAADVAKGERPDERHQILDQLIPRSLVALRLVRVEKTPALPLGGDSHDVPAAALSLVEESSSHSPSSSDTTATDPTRRSATRRPAASSSGSKGPTTRQTPPSSPPALPRNASPLALRCATRLLTASWSSLTCS